MAQYLFHSLSHNSETAHYCDHVRFQAHMVRQSREEKAREIYGGHERTLILHTR